MVKLTFEETMEIDPTFKLPLVEIGNCYMKMGRTKKAKDAFTRYLKFEPSDPHLHLKMAQAYHDMGNTKKAMSHLSITLNVWKDADPGIDRVENAKELLNELEDRDVERQGDRFQDDVFLFCVFLCVSVVCVYVVCV